MSRKRSNKLQGNLQKAATVKSSVDGAPPSTALGNLAGSAVSYERVRMWKMSRFNPIRNLTPESLVRVMDTFQAGQLREFALMMDAIERRDDMMQSVAWKRKSATARRKWEILTVEALSEGRKAEAEAHRRALMFFYDNLRVTNAVDMNERGGTALLIRQMMDAIGKGYAVHEIIWEFDPTTGNAPGPSDNAPLPSDSLGRGETRPYLPSTLVKATLQFVPLWFFENRTGRLRFLKTDFAYDGEELEEGAWMVTKGQGIMEACAVAYMFKRLPLQDWLHYCAKHGSPGIQGKTDAEKGSEPWNNLVEAVTAISSNFSCVTGIAELIEKIDLSTEGQLPYEALVARMDRAIATLWRGADLSTISSGNGAGTGASLQGEEADMIEADDAAMISETLQSYLDAKVIEYVFGPGVEPLAYMQVVYTPKQDTDQDIKIDEFLLSHGAPLSVARAMERYGRPMPDGVEELLKPILQNANPNGGQAGSLRYDGQQMANEDLNALNATAAKTANLNALNATAAKTAKDDEELVRNSLAAALGVRPKWLAPIRPFLNALVIKIKEPGLSDAALLDFLEKSAGAVPELLGDMNVSALADVLEGALGTEVVHGVKDALRLNAKGQIPNTKPTEVVG